MPDWAKVQRELAGNQDVADRRGNSQATDQAATQRAQREERERVRSARRLAQVADSQRAAATRATKAQRRAST